MSRPVKLPWKDLRKIIGRRLRGLVPYVPALAVSGFLGSKAIRAILERAGHPAVPLDDTFIHFQFAKNLAAGHFFTYSPGDGYTAGATSFAWPMLLAPFYALGFHDLSIIWVAWVFGFLAHAALIVETTRLASRLTGWSVAVGAGAMAALFGGFLWFAASGMETIPLAWALARTARIASEWCERTPSERTRAQRVELIAFGILAPLIRPEGALASLFAAVALGACPMPSPRPWWRTRPLALVPLLGPLIMPLTNLLMTGSASSNTMAVKWMPLSPYYPTLAALWKPVHDNLVTFFTVLVDGREWSAVFVPKDSMPAFVLALVAIPVVGWRAKRPWRAGFVLVLALGMLIPCTYSSFLWNRLRYLWPFASAWFVGLACGARLLGEAAALIRPRWIAVAPALSGLAAGGFSTLLSWTIEDLSKSATAVDKQQVTLGRWAREHLPQDAIIGVNDTGAIAYESDRRTFDVVGLTTKGEAKYWVAGAGSRFEHYERLVKRDPQRFPTDFIVYPQWMACEPVLGPQMHEATVRDQTILGGVTMVVYPARRDLLGSGDLPLQERLLGQPIDELDVADLESEADHAYEIEHATGADLSNRVHYESPDTNGADRAWADGGRFQRSLDRFEAHLPEGTAVRGIARLVGPLSADVDVVVSVGGQDLATLHVPADEATEQSFEIPADKVKARTVVELRPLEGTFGSLHYWFEKAR